jgi:SsrA-binding protein
MPEDYDSERTRKLLLKKEEILYLGKKTDEKGLTIVPLSMYTKKNKIKLEIGLCKSKNKQDKRETIKKRDLDREINREIKK